jgi:peroxiredoxin Q/BCP
MLHPTMALSAAALLLLGTAACASAAKADLKPGDAAPAFDLVGSDGKTHRLADYLGKQAVVVAWFPKAFTGG